MNHLKINNGRRVFYPLATLALLAFCSFTFALTKWNVKKEGYEVRFEGGRIHGTFETLKADITFDKDSPEKSKISAVIDVNSIATGFFLKNDHAKNALDAEHFPNISFASANVTKTASGYQAAGNLKMKGVTRQVTIHFTFEDKGNEGVFKGGFKIIPKDFGITHNGTPDEMTITLTVPVTKS